MFNVEGERQNREVLVFTENFGGNPTTWPNWLTPSFLPELGFQETSLKTQLNASTTIFYKAPSFTPESLIF
jgi:hypothetical protein